MGTPGMSSGVSNTFVFGGYVVSESDLPKAITAWQRIKTEMCGDANVELKWKHFFVHADDPKIPTPIMIKNPKGRRYLAALALEHLFREAPIIPAVAVARKDRATGTFIVQSKKGNDKIDYDLMWLGPVAQFALFLSVQKGQGKLWLDRLGSQKHEIQRQNQWSQHRQNIEKGNSPKSVSDSLREMLAIQAQIEFFDSQDNEAIQIADFVCGVIWQAAEGDEAYLSQFIDKYGPKATKQGLGILHIA